MKLSLKEIAKLAGVSSTTASIVINGKAEEYRISPSTKKKIEDVVQKYNYSPNQTARGLRRQKTETLGFVVPRLTTYYFSQIATHLENVARKAGYQIFIGMKTQV